MNKFSVVANGVTLDTYDKIGVSINYQIEDILNITKRTTNYSKTITIPGTPHNNKFFKQIFDVNVDTITFNPKRAIPSVIRVGEQEVMNGVMMLLNININQNQVDYEICIFGKLKNIIQEWGDYTLKNIDLSEYNHLRSIENITDSWDYTIQKFGNPITNLNTGEGYVYPYIIYGNHTDIYDKMYASCMFPSVYLKTIIDKSFNLAGYTYTSNFFNSEYFRKLIIPFTEDKLQMDETEINKRTTSVGIDGYNYYTTTCPLLNNTWLYSLGFGSGYRAVTPVLENQSGDDNGWYKNYENGRGYYFPLDKETGSIGDITLQDPDNQWFLTPPTQSCSNNNGFAYYQNKNAGYYDISLDCEFYMYYIHNGGNDLEFKNGDIKYFGRIVIERTNGSTTIIDNTDFPVTFQPSGGEHNSPWIDTATPCPVNMSATNVYLGVGDKVRLGFGLEYKNVGWKNVQDINVYAQAIIPPSTNSEYVNLTIEPSNNTLMGKDDSINMNQVLPNIKIKDLFVSLLKMFNLVVYDNPDKENDLIIEPRDDFYFSRKKVKDWTYLLDYNKLITITPMSELDSKTFLYTYKEDSDYYNQSYIEEFDELYGTYEIDVDNDFSIIESKNEILFSPTPDASWGIGSRVAPYFCDVQDNDLKPKRVKPRILFYDGLKNSSNNITILDYIGQPLNEGDLTTQYPYTGMWDDPSNPQNDLGFGLTKKTYFNTSFFPVNTLIEKFHKNTLFDIIDINSKLMEASFYLTPKDIAEFDFRDIILIDNAYWRVYKIKDYNPIGNEKTTTCILYKLNNIFLNDSGVVDITFSNKSCPTDIIQKYNKRGSYYISQSGQIITKDCCDSLGARWSEGRCFSGLRWDSIITKGEYGGKLKGLVVQGGSNVTPNQSTLTEKQVQDGNTNNSPGVVIRGQNNFVGNNVKSSFIFGDGSSIPSGGKNQLVIGDGITSTTPNSIQIGNLLFTEDGIKDLQTPIIDGGLNEVMRVNKTNLIDIIDGGLNSVLPYGGDSKLRPIIDGSINEVVGSENDWLLTGGIWNDVGLWDDDNIWID